MLIITCQTNVLILYGFNLGMYSDTTYELITILEKKKNFKILTYKCES